MQIGSAVAAARVSSQDVDQTEMVSYALDVLRKSSSPELRRGAYEALVSAEGAPVADMMATDAEILRRRGR